MSAVGQNLDDLLQRAGLKAAAGQVVPSLSVSGVAMDSRAVRAGDLFLAMAGAGTHGLRFVDQAVAAGACAVVHDGLAPNQPSSNPVPLIEVPDLRARCGELASLAFSQPSARIDVLGVTGTNGKTSVVNYLAQALTAIGHRVGTQGTLGSGLHGALQAAERTTPDAAQTQRWLAEMVAAGADCVAMEVSSHALDQGRVDGTRFKLALFTNLSRDHLDYHLDMESYFQAKARLFAWPGLDVAVVNADDPWGRRLLQQPLTGHVISYGEHADAHLRATSAELNATGMRVQISWQGRRAELQLPLLGRFNLANALGVAAALLGLGHDLDVVVRGLAALQPVPGRMQWLDGGAQGAVVVDYAHTPDALALVLQALRQHCSGKLRVIFGCGGERDPGKRAPMGEIAERLADEVIISDDNPRGESAQSIAAQILEGCTQPQRVAVIHDRAAAIAAGLAAGQVDDLLLIAGKGHERTQESMGVRRPFDDVAVAQSWLEAQRC